jgi:xylulose-5-phosphate/fructose-6-phosphate phosphoketolase
MSVTTQTELTSDQLQALDGYWRAANYLSVGQIYLMANPLLAEPLRPEHIKPRLLGHWGTTPGLNFLWSHLNRAIVTHGLDMMYVIGPGHGGPAAIASTWLDGSYSDIYPSIPRDLAGMGRLFHQFSFPGGVPSHVAPETPGSIHEGGELGYSLSHAHGAAFDNPDLIVACVIGDGEAETGPLATSWHSGKFLNPDRDGAVLPILHLNGWKIANPTMLARIPEQELDALLRGYGYAPVFITGSDPQAMHAEMASVLDQVIARIREIQGEARSRGRRNGSGTRQRWPMIVMRTPKGWTGPAEVDGHPVEGTWRAHQVPLAEVRTNPAHLRQLEDWMRSYRPGELFGTDGRPRGDILGFVPPGERRMGSNPHANGGLLLRDLALPDFRDYAVTVDQPGATLSEPTRVLGSMLRDVARLNAAAQNFRVVGPDETQSNRLDALLEVTGKTWEEATLPVDEHLAPDGRVMEILSETTCQGWLEGYLLTGRHGLFSCYEAAEDHPGAALAAARRVAELPAHLARVAAGPQRVQPSGPGLHRPRGEQEGGGRPGLPAPGHQHPAVRGRPLPAQPGLRERDRGGQAAVPRLAGHGRRRPALHPGRRDLGVGQQRPGRHPARRRAGLRR